MKKISLLLAFIAFFGVVSFAATPEVKIKKSTAKEIAKSNTVKPSVENKVNAALYCKKTYYDAFGNVTSVVECWFCSCSDI